MAEKCINYNFLNCTWSNGKIYGRLQRLWDKIDRILGKERALDPERMHWGIRTRTEELCQQSPRWEHFNNKQSDWSGVGKTEQKGRWPAGIQAADTEKQSRCRDMIIFNFNFVLRAIKNLGINKLALDFYP